MGALDRIICLAVGYVFGCFQSAYIFGRLFKNIDIRKHGSGNAGMANATRVMGTKYGALVFFADVLKAVIAYLVCSFIFHGDGTFTNGANGVLPGLYAGFGVVLGHNFPAFLKFRGGKGIAASVGVILMFDFRAALIIFVIGGAAILLTRYVSLGSLMITFLFPVFALVFGYGAEVAIVCAAYTVLTYFMHRENIKRLLAGSERKFTLFTKGKL